MKNSIQKWLNSILQSKELDILEIYLICHERLNSLLDLFLKLYQTSQSIDEAIQAYSHLFKETISILKNVFTQYKSDSEIGLSGLRALVQITNMVVFTQAITGFVKKEQQLAKSEAAPENEFNNGLACLTNFSQALLFKDFQIETLAQNILTIAENNGCLVFCGDCKTLAVLINEVNNTFKLDKNLSDYLQRIKNHGRESINHDACPRFTEREPWFREFFNRCLLAVEATVVERAEMFEVDEADVIKKRLDRNPVINFFRQGREPSLDKKASDLRLNLNLKFY